MDTLSKVFSLLNARLLQYIHIKINVYRLLFENDSFDNVYNSSHPVIFTKFQGFSSFQKKWHLYLRNHLTHLVVLAVHFHCTIWTLLKIQWPQLIPGNVIFFVNGNYCTRSWILWLQETEPTGSFESLS